jgi:hypothetical protein
LPLVDIVNNVDEIIGLTSVFISHVRTIGPRRNLRNHEPTSSCCRRRRRRLRRCLVRPGAADPVSPSVSRRIQSRWAYHLRTRGGRRWPIHNGRSTALTQWPGTISSPLTPPPLRTHRSPPPSYIHEAHARVRTTKTVQGKPSRPDRMTGCKTGRERSLHRARTYIRTYASASSHTYTPGPVSTASSRPSLLGISLCTFSVSRWLVVIRCPVCITVTTTLYSGVEKGWAPDSLPTVKTM